MQESYNTNPLGLTEKQTHTYIFNTASSASAEPIYTVA